MAHSLTVGAGAAAAVSAAGEDTARALELHVATDAASYALGQPVVLTATLTNRTSAPCALPTHGALTLRLDGVTRDDEPVVPTVSTVWLDAGAVTALVASAEPVPDGDAVTLTLPAVGPAEDGVALGTLHALPTGSALRTDHVLDRPGTYRVALRAEVPAVDEALCAGTSNTAVAKIVITDAAADSPVTADRGPRAAGIGVAVLVVLAVLAAWLVLRRRGRTGAGAATTVLLLLAALLVVPVPPARALVTTGVPEESGLPDMPKLDEWNGAVNWCLASLRDRSRHTAETWRVMEFADRPDTRIHIRWTSDQSSAQEDSARGRILVEWNHTNKGPLETGLDRDPCAALFHELAHAYRIGTGQVAPPGRRCGALSVSYEEAHTTFLENAYRVHNGAPPRTEYDRHRLPADLSDCEEDPPPGPTRLADPDTFFEGVPSGESTGDPHLQTFDGVRFSPQAVGELVLARSREDLDVQVRQAPLGPSRQVSVNTAVAMDVGGDRVVVGLDDGALTVTLDGEPWPVQRAVHTLPGGGTVAGGPSSRTWAPDGVLVTWRDGSAVQVDPVGASGLEVQVRRAPDRAGDAVGLLGDGDGDVADEHTTRGGAVLARPLTHDDLYGELVESWRVRDEESLFDYAPGESTETFTDRTFPDAAASGDASSEDRRALAEEVCRAAGVRDGSVLEECAVDVAASGRVEFAVAAATTADRVTARAMARAVPVVRFEDATAVGALDPDALAVLAAPGASARLTFDATIGDAVLVELAWSTLPDGCGWVRLVQPDGSVARTACLSDGGGVLDRVELTAGGTHRLEIDPPGDAVGQVAVRLHRPVDGRVPAVVGGDAVTVPLGTPGARGLVTFEASAGGEVVVALTRASVLDGCGFVQVRGPDGSRAAASCVSRGAATVTIPVTTGGTHEVVLDPPGATVGSAVVRVSEAS
ncbi:VWD domain-containing protein [uncultured Cellulomonas sp.]|uniref:VWD domain-containing protein n=1 Tax=uncultured Cellulomonas sp. TaxID=189682 RepID=UPI0028EE8041|nr:VWD domain-containing protein [uncultured Cellulomonas sp.]